MAKFDRAKYMADYRREHYKTVNTFMTFDSADIVLDAIETSGKSINAWMREAIQEKLERSE